MERTYMKRPAARVRSASRGTPSRARPSIPNSSLPGAMDGGMGREALRQIMREKMINQFGPPHVDMRAEAEADRIGSRFSDASSVDDLKARMGADLGADFSSVRFHTGAEAAAKAPTAEDSFSAGRDIYLGGGFNPVIAAHEMVHTMQTGAVHGAASVTSAPAGAVQGWNGLDVAGAGGRADRIDTLMRIGRFGGKVGRGIGRLGRAIGRGIGKLGKAVWGGIKAFPGWAKGKAVDIYNGLKKANHKAIDQYHEYNEDYKKMSGWERFKWALNNPIAFMRRNMKGAKADSDARRETRRKADAEEMGYASKLSDMWTDKSLGDAAGMARPTRGPAEQAGPVEQGGIPAAGGGLDDEDMPKALEEKPVLLPHLLGDAANIYAHKKNADTLNKEGDISGAAREESYLIGDAIGAGGKLFGLPGISSIPGANVISNGLAAGSSAFKTGVDIGSALDNGSTQSKLGERNKNLEKEVENLQDESYEDMEAEERYKLSRQRAVKQGTEAARIRKNDNIVDAVSNSISTLGSGAATILNAADLAIPGLGTMTGTVVSGAGSILSGIAGGIGHAVTGSQKKDLRHNTVNEELDIEGKIKALQSGDSAYTDRLGITKEQAQAMTRSQAKHIILKSMGFSSGKYKEAFNQITKNRARALTKRANEGGDEEIGIMKDMMLARVDDGQGGKKYSAAGVARKLGYQEYDKNPFARKARENQEDQ